MPETTAELVDLLSLEPIEVNLFRGHQLASHLQRTFGGLVLAQALSAAYATIGDDRQVHSLHAYFLREGKIGKPIIYDVESLRDGRTFSSRRVLVRQEGRIICHLSASFHVSEEGLRHEDPFPMEVPAPDECPEFREVMRAQHGDSPMWREWDALDVRVAGTSAPGGLITPHAHGAHMRLWIKTSDRIVPQPGPLAAHNGQRLHDAILAYLSDLSLLSVSTVPHEVAFLSRSVQAVSIDHAMWFHRAFRADDWLLYDQVSPSASRSLGLGQGRLFQNGDLVAFTTQEGLIRVLPDADDPGRM